MFHPISIHLSTHSYRAAAWLAAFAISERIGIPPSAKVPAPHESRTLFVMVGLSVVALRS